MILDQLRNSRTLSLAVLNGCNTWANAQVEDMCGRQLLLSLEQPVSVGDTVKLTWDGNTILGEIQGTHTHHGKLCYVLLADQLLRAEASYVYDGSAIGSVGRFDRLDETREGLTPRSPRVGVVQRPTTEHARHDGIRDRVAAFAQILSSRPTALDSKVMATVTATLDIVSMLASEPAESDRQRLEVRRHLESTQEAAANVLSHGARSL
jgi:hypothetical protein